MSKTKNKSTRIKLVLTPPVIARNDAEALANEITAVTLSKLKILALRDEAILKAKEFHAAGLEQCDAELASKTEALRIWAEANPGEFPKNRKSIKFASAVVGFRDGTPKVELLNRKWTWDKALQAVRQWLPNFIRNAPEIDKEGILASRDEIAEFLPNVGLQISQDKSFYVDPIIAKTETRQVSEAA